MPITTGCVPPHTITKANKAPIDGLNPSSRSRALAMASLSWGEGGGVATSHRNNALSQNATNEEFNREAAIFTEADNHNIITPIRNHPQHHYTPGIPLSSAFQIHAYHPHAATAAEIALGINSPFHKINRAHEAELSMVAAHHPHDNIHRNFQSTDKSADISSVIESLREVDNQGKDEEHTSRTSDTGLVTSPGRMTPLNDSQHGNDHPRIIGIGFGTPSTVSTAPSTDDASFATTDYRLDDSHLPNLLAGTNELGGSPSLGDDGLLPGEAFGGPFMPQLQEGQWPSSGSTIRSTSIPWNTAGGELPHVATFRDRGQPVPLPMASRSARDGQQHNYVSTWQTPPQYPQRRHQEYGGQGASLAGVSSGYQQQNSRTGYGGPPPLPSTPPRPRNARQLGSMGPPGHRQPAPAGQQGTLGSHPAAGGTSTQQRSSSEILKTLLRKKACLYEPDTSRAVALVTWLVGRELALNFGFFSRQQLQSGVHACVASKIESGIITRTKVNRCMQIILNSCFHYIIPRSDGTEEKGDTFTQIFSQTVQDDSFMLRHLPTPWNDLHVDAEFILEACLAEDDDEEAEKQANISTPKSSPRMSSTKPPTSPGGDKDSDDYDSKRSVLLCFNENVRCAEDVVRCHNEFIRDTANAAHLQLTAQEWWNFFGREASRAPYLWGNVGIPVPSPEATFGHGRGQVDPLGQMSEDEACKFRTTWCAKRYEHDHNLCGFAHVEVGGGWLRRNPAVFDYQDQMCPLVFWASDSRVSSTAFFLNECPRGVHCDLAHSLEEILYHPQRYKTKSCTASMNRCKLGGICPKLHPAESPRPSNKKSSERTQPRHHKKNDLSIAATCKPVPVVLPGSPMVYASPAPFSSFDRHLGMPGLQCLFRRHCSVIRAHVHTQGPCACVYSCFGDDLGTKDVRTETVVAESRSAQSSAPGA